MPEFLRVLKSLKKAAETPTAITKPQNALSGSKEDENKPSDKAHHP